MLSYWEKKQINNSAWTGEVWILSIGKRERKRIVFARNLTGKDQVKTIDGEWIDFDSETMKVGTE